MFKGPVKKIIRKPEDLNIQGPKKRGKICWKKKKGKRLLESGKQEGENKGGGKVRQTTTKQKKEGELCFKKGRDRLRLTRNSEVMERHGF